MTENQEKKYKDEIELLKDHIERMGMRSNECTQSVTKRICIDCKCGKSEKVKK